ncbi:hypothetical protein FPQ18DRAFT_353147 [Pyronema domesticum]|nr:hypothetical protein FPQ18DRAFT_353147 [Pyronema domesticum]
MLTGVETVGIALALFPLLVNGVQSYLDGTRKVNDMWRWKRSLRRLRRELETECSLFENTCEHLLQQIVSEDEVYALLNGKGWEDLGFIRKLSAHMGERIAASFVSEVKELSKFLQKLQDRLIGLRCQDDQGNMLTVMKHILNRDFLSMANVKEINSRIERLAPRRAGSVTAKKSCTNAAKVYGRLRDHALSLHSVFQEKFGSVHDQCTATHTVSLQLLKVITATRQSPDDLKFIVLFSYDNIPRLTQQTDWFEMEFEPVDSKNAEVAYSDQTPIQSGISPRFTDNTSTLKSNTAESYTIKSAFRSALKGLGGLRQQGDTKSKPKKSARFNEPSRRTPDIDVEIIENLCTEIRNAGSQNPACCVGRLASKASRLKISSLKSLPRTSYLHDSISLETLLKRNKLEKRDRLRLGVVLASAAIQLHDSVWLNENWGKQDIFFLQAPIEDFTVDGVRVRMGKPILQRPLVRYKFSPSLKLQHENDTSLGKSQSTVSIVWYNKCLFSLGLVLLELWFGQRFEDLCASKSLDCEDENTKYASASILIKTVQEEAGQMYESAVRRCIKGIDHPESNLENDGYKNQVHEQIIRELEDNLTAFDSEKSEE